MTEIINLETTDADALYKYVRFCLEKVGVVKLYNLTLDKLTNSGNLYFYYTIQGHGPFRIMCYINLHTGYYNAFEPRYRRYIHHSIIKGIPNYFEFLSNNEERFMSVPNGILKIPKKLGV